MEENKNLLDTIHTLTVYKADAGSGKTFTLAVNYLVLLIKNPTNYKNILAVTFTNKATTEMKMRIITHLYGIAKELENSESYLKEVAKSTRMSEQEIRHRAQTALNYIIHDYNYFHIETIDSFFQTVLRNLAHELNLNANLRIELHDRQVQQKAVDRLIENLKPNDQVLRWILEYIRQTMDENNNWNIISQIKDFGKNIFKDAYKQHEDELNSTLTDHFFRQFKQQLHELKSNIKKELDGYVTEFYDILQKHGETIDALSGKRTGVAAYFICLDNQEYDKTTMTKNAVIKAKSDPSAWLKKEDQDNPELCLLAKELTELLNRADEKRIKDARMYKSADVLLRHLDQLRLLNTIEKEVRSINSDTNSFLLSDTQLLLHQLIDNNDAPFIYEKIGTEIQHIMIDEFQDTGKLQWENFKILLEECMGHQNSSNLIVGDIKQSIYRWRSGDWKLLANIKNELRNPHLIEEKTLQDNYRSDENIVRFNNKFFHDALELEQKSLKEDGISAPRLLRAAYENVGNANPIHKNQSGLVRIKLFPAKDGGQAIMEEIKQTISLLLENNIQQEDIAILVRNNKTIESIATFLTENMPEVQLVSDEAFCLHSSSAINTIVNALRVMLNPTDNLLKASLYTTYRHTIMEDNVSQIPPSVHADNYDELLPGTFLHNIQSLMAMPFSDLILKIINIFQLDVSKNQSAYLCKFIDVVNEFLRDNVSDIETFLHEWDENLHQNSIQSDDTGGVRLLTIHKSKGLERDHVLVPFCDWKLEGSDTFWVTTDEHPFNQLPAVPVTYSKTQLFNTVYEDDYKKEHLQNTIDNLNLLYVAFTRPKKNLFVFAKRATRSIRSFLIQNFIVKLKDENPDGENSLSPVTIEGDIKDQKSIITFEYGDYDFGRNNESFNDGNVFTAQKGTEYIGDFNSPDTPLHFLQTNKSRDFTAELEGKGQQVEYIKTGNILHQLFSRIETVDDLDAQLRELEFDGILTDKPSIEKMIRRRFGNPVIKDWFSDKWKVFNESTILFQDAESGKILARRPDRVMTDGEKMIVIDFKFGTPKPEYAQQVRDYMLLLNDMGYKNVEGYLWFVYSNLIEKIEND